MKFKDFLRESYVSPSIDDNDILTILDNNGIGYTRLKSDYSNNLLYVFDNRYSMSYDGSLCTLYRHGNRIHYMNARNESEIIEAIEKWNSSYDLASIEVSDDDIEKYIEDLKSGDVKHSEFDSGDDDLKSDDDNDQEDDNDDQDDDNDDIDDIDDDQNDDDDDDQDDDTDDDTEDNDKK